MEMFYIATININIRTDKEIKEQAKKIFNEFDSNITAAAIEEGRKMIKDPSSPRYSSMDALNV